jgi:hypothetical protein
VLEVIVEWVIERVVPSGNFSILTKANYFEWAALMRVMLQARGMWAVFTEGGIEYTEDRMALEVIAKAVPPEMLGSIVNKTLVKAVWDSIILRNVGVDRVCKSKVNLLKHEFDSITFHDGESVDDFGACIGRIANLLAVLGFKYQEEII